MILGDNRLWGNNKKTLRKSSRIVDNDLPINLDLDIIEVDDNLIVTSIFEGVGYFFDIYCVDGIYKYKVLIPKWSIE